MRPGPVARTLSIIGQLVTEYAPARLDEDTAAVKVDAYEDAVGDLPAWAIREAVRRWRRGEVSGDARDLDFAPKPARLRRIAQSIAATATGQAIRLQRILDAEAEEPVSDAVRAENAKRADALVRQLSSPAGGPDDRAEREAENRARADRLTASETARKAKVGADSHG